MGLSVRERHMRTWKRLVGLRKYALTTMLGTTLAIGSCNLGEFTSTSTVTLSGREVVSFLVRSWILTPIQDAIDNGINKLFDNIEGDGTN
jgi:hypothetical protein